MKYILLVGTKDAGKSTTIDAVCKRLKPDAVKQLHWDRTFKDVSPTQKIRNGTYIIQVKGKFVLVVAGAPTEQGIRITVLIQVCIELNIKIDFVLVVMRSYERSEGFNTRQELKELGECVYEETIYQIPGDNYQGSVEWNERVNKIVDCIQANL
jgi:molybdopterin-guanine dinucleotide biosynthesis protein